MERDIVFMKRITLSIMVLLIAGALNAQSYQLNRAKSLIDNKQYTEAAKTLRPLADGGDAEAQYLAAMLFKDPDLDTLCLTKFTSA